ncbi:MAG: DUF1963 domain-containing protein [Deltaproteobacteria bacterium]|nr:MAG: DUF1963 domain-containing protein [Deltaproteobacteria bacterium]
MAKARRKKKIKLHDLASEPGTEAMEDFLSTEPESYKLDSLAQDICRQGRMDLLELYIAYPHHSLFGLMAGLGQAAWHNQIDIIRRILATDYDPLEDLKLNNQHFRSALEQAAIQGNDECLQLLLNAGSDPNYAPDDSEYKSCDITGQDGKTPLLQAIRSGKCSTVQLLVEAGAEVNRKTQAHRRPLAVAEDLQHDDIVAYLKEQGAEHIQPSELDLEQAASRGFAERVDELLQENPPDEYDSRMLARTASREGHLDVLKLLFKYEATDEARNIALEYVQLYDHYNLVEPLLALGAPVDPPGSTTGQTPLWLAVTHERYDVAKRYLKLGADPNRAQQVDGNTALITASRSDNAEIVRMLLEAGANPHTKNEYGDTALSEAQKYGTPEIVALLEAAGATVRTPQQIKAAVKRRMKKFAHPSWRPKPGKSHSSDPTALGWDWFGGWPMLLPTDTWPQCSSCRNSLSFAVQLKLENLPNPHPLCGEGLVQFFFCTECVDDVMLRCLNASDEWLVHGQSKAPDDVETFRMQRIAGWYKKTLDFPYNEPDNKAIVEAKSALAPEEENLLWKMNLSGDKLGGYPCWIQHNEYPHCSDCSERMELLLQIDSHDNLRYTWGDNGAAWIFQCVEHRERLAFVWQCS